MKYKVFLLTVILFFSFSLGGFPQYARLVGKWAKVNGPRNFSKLGVAVDKNTCDKLILVLDKGDREFFYRMLGSFNIFRIENHTSVLVLDVKILEDKAKVMVLTGLQSGVSGWIPIEWLNGNSKQPTFSRPKVH